MNGRLPDGLPFLILKDVLRGPVRLERVRRAGRYLDPVRPDLVLKKIGADQGLDKTILARRQIARQVDLARDLRANAIELATELAIRGGRHSRHIDREMVGEGLRLLETDVLARDIHGHS